MIKTDLVTFWITTNIPRPEEKSSPKYWAVSYYGRTLSIEDKSAFSTYGEAKGYLLKYLINTLPEMALSTDTRHKELKDFANKTMELPVEEAERVLTALRDSLLGKTRIKIEQKPY